MLSDYLGDDADFSDALRAFMADLLAEPTK